MTVDINAFAARLQAQGHAWGLRAPDDAWAVHEDPEDDSEALLLWLDEAAARRNAVGDWAAFAPAQIPLAELVEEWLPALDEDAAWVGLDFTPEAQGELADPLALRERLAERA